jgi:hypothetical protein
VEMMQSGTAASVSPEQCSVFSNLWLFRVYTERQCLAAITKPYFAAKLFLNSGMHFLSQFFNSVQKSICFIYFAGFNYMKCDDNPKLS